MLDRLSALDTLSVIPAPSRPRSGDFTMSTLADAVVRHGHDHHLIEVADETLSFRSVQIDDLTPTGDQLAHAAGSKPPDSAVVLQMLADGALETIRPDETVDLRQADGRFVIVQSDRLYLLSIEGERF